MSAAAIQPIPATGLACVHCGEQLQVVPARDGLVASCPTHGVAVRDCRRCGMPMPSIGKRGRPATTCPQGCGEVPS